LRSQRAGLAFIFVTLLIDILGWGIIVPVLPHLVQTLSGGTADQGAHAFGLLLSAFGLMQFLFAPVLGSLSDRYGRRPVLLLSLLFSTVDYLIQATAPSLPWLFVGRVLAGITSASFTAASAYVADISPPEKRAQNFGLIGAAFGIGFILGPAAGGLLGNLSPRAPFWAAAAISLLNCLYGLFVLPESLAQENRRRFSWKTANPISGFGVLARFPIVREMSLAIALNAVAQQILQSVWVLYTESRFAWKPLDNGLSLALVGLGFGVVQAVLTRFAVAGLGERRAVLGGLLLNAAGLLGYGLATHGWMMYAIIVVWCLGGVAGPTIQGLISREYGPDEQGVVQGALTGMQSLIGIVGPVLGTGIFGYFTGAGAPVQAPGAPFFLAAILGFAATGLAGKALRRLVPSFRPERSSRVEPGLSV